QAASMYALSLALPGLSSLHGRHSSPAPATSGPFKFIPLFHGKRMMETIRLSSADSIFPKIPCCRCSDQSRFWDRLAGKTYCPNCLEALAMGEGDPLVARTDRKRSAVCHHLGTVRFVTFPLH